MRFWPVVSAVVVGLTLVAAPAASGQLAPRALELSRGLNAHTTALSVERYALAAGPLTGEAAPGRAGRLIVRLWAGQDYVFAAACDAHCGDLTLRLIDPSGVELARDQSAAAAPVLRVRPVVTGRHVIEAATTRCRAQTCWFAVNVYAR
jgi:hypothetical protein